MSLLKVTLMSVFLSCMNFPFSFQLPETLKIGAFLENDEYLKKVFETAVQSVNNEGSLLETQLVGVVVDESTPTDCFEAEMSVCDLMAQETAAIFGPSTRAVSDHVQSICDTMEVPHIIARWDPDQRRSSCSVNLYPHPSTLSQAIVDVVRSWQWKGFTILFEAYESLTQAGSLLQMANDRGFIVTARQLRGTDEDIRNFRPELQSVKHSEEKNIIVVCSGDLLFDLLAQAYQTGLVGTEYSYLITSLDLHSIDLEPFKWAGTNITGFRMFDADNPSFAAVAKKWESDSTEDQMVLENESLFNLKRRKRVAKRKQRKAQADDETPYPGETDFENEGGDLGNEYDVYKEREEDEDENKEMDEPEPAIKLRRIPKVEEVLLYDAVKLFSKAVTNLDLLEPRSLDCKSYAFWESGFSIINYMKMSEFEGLSGNVKFDNEGFRTEIELEIVSLEEEGLVRKGTWTNPASGPSVLAIEHPKTAGETVVQGDDLKNVTFVVLIALTHPYGMLKEDSKTLEGNDRFEGFGIDLINELSMMSGFNYSFKVQEDKNSGKPSVINGTRVWDGMIGEVLAGNADLAIADITIMRERARDAEFTTPFMNLGISILYKKAQAAPPSLFSFLSPFSLEVWAYTMSAFIGVSLLLYVMGRISPNEWNNPYPCNEEPDELENQFSLLNSFWFTIGSLMQQGTEIAPRATSTRMTAAIWWFFTLIMVSSYTANLAAFLTVESKVEAFRNVEELANHKKIKYGAKKDGSTDHFFRDSSHPVYQKMYKFMQNNPDVMMPSNEAGVERVMREDNYAFLMESTSIEYEIERNCKITQVGGLLDTKGYGIVMRQNSTYRHVLERDLVSLQEQGKVTQMIDKWWREKRGGGACSFKSQGDGASELDLANVGGVFVVLLGGCFFATFLAIFELLWDIYQREDKESFKEELIMEIKFILRCRGNVKPVKKSNLDLLSHKSERSRSRPSDICSFGDFEPLD